MADVADVLYRGQQEFTKMDEEAKRVNASARAADAFVKANPEFLQQLGVSAEQWKAGGSRDRAAAFTGLLQSQGYRKAQQEQAHLQELIRASQQQREEDSAAGSLLRNFAIGPIGQNSPTTPPADLSQLISQAAPESNPAIPESLRPAAGLDPQARALLLGPYPTGQAPSPVAAAPGSAPAAAPAGDFQARLRYALGNTPGIGGKGIRGLLEGIAQLQKVQEGAIPAPVSYDEDPVTGNRFASKAKAFMPSGINPEKAQFVPAIDQNGNVIPSLYRLGNRAVTMPEANAAQQQNADTTTLHQSELALQGVERAIGAWNAQAADNLKDPKATPAPDPATLKNLQRRRENLNAIVEKVGAALSGGTAAPAAPAKTTNFDSLSQAVKAGHKAGDVIMLLNPKTGKYQRFQME